MRMTVTTPRAATASGLPRGWTIMGLALASWMLLAGVWVAGTQLFSFVAAAL